MENSLLKDLSEEVKKLSKEIARLDSLIEKILIEENYLQKEAAKKKQTRVEHDFYQAIGGHGADGIPYPCKACKNCDYVEEM